MWRTQGDWQKHRTVNFRVFDGQVAPPYEQAEAAAEEEHHQQQTLVQIDMQKLNHFINKPFGNGFCVLEYSKLKMYEIYLPLF